MNRNTITLTLTAVTLFFAGVSTAEAQMFKKAKARKAARFESRMDGLPLRDTVPFGATPRHHIRNHSINPDGSLKWIPNQAIPRNGVVPQPAFQPPARNPFAAGPTAGGTTGGPVRIQIRTRPVTPQPRPQPTGWQPWMHVPLDGSQPWNN